MDLSALGFAAVGFAIAAYVWRDSRPPYWDPRYATRAMRVPVWLLAIGIILMGVLGAIDLDLMVFGVLFLAAAAAWIVGLFVLAVVAPRYVARTIYHPTAVAIGASPGHPVPTLEEMEATARKASYAMLAIAAVGAAGYYLWTRWLGPWTLFVAYLAVLSFIVYQALKPATSEARARKDRPGGAA